MKHKLLPLSLLSLSCAVPPSPVSPVIVNLQTPKYSYPQEQRPEPQEKELSLEKKIGTVIKYLKKMPPGEMRVRNGSGHFTYSYATYCAEEKTQKHHKVIFFSYSRIALSEVVLFDAPPFGSVDGVLLVSNAPGNEPSGEYYKASEPAQKFYQIMLDLLYQELEQHYNKGRHWTSFGTEREIDDPEKKLGKAYEELREDLSSKDSTPPEEVEFLALCSKN